MPSLTYADIPLLYDFQHAAQAFLDRYQRIEDLIPELRTTSLDSWQTQSNQRNDGMAKGVGLPRYNWPDPPPLRVNQMYWPTGASRFSYGLFLIDRENLTALEAKDCKSSYVLKASHETVPAVTPDAAGTSAKELTFDQIYFLTPHRISGCDTESDLFLLPLVDRRYWWQFIDAEDVKTVLQETGSLCQTECKATWNDLLSHIASRIGETYEAGDISSAYGKPDCYEFNRNHSSLPVFMDAVAASIGKRIVSKLDGTISFQDAADAYDELIDNIATLTNQIAGNDCLGISQKHLPQQVRVVFPVSYCHHLECNGEKHALEYDVSHPCSKTGYIKTIHSTAVAEYECVCEDDREDPANESELQALTDKIGEDWRLWRQYDYDFTFAAPQAWEPTGFDDHILWTFGAEQFDCYDPITSYATGRTGEDTEPEVSLVPVFRRDHQTRVQSLPLTCDVDSMFHHLGDMLLPDTVLVKITDCWTQDSECCGTDSKWLTTDATVHFWCDCDYTTGDYTIPIHTSISHLCEMFDELAGRVQNGDPIPVLDNCCEYLWAKWNCAQNRWHVEAKYDDLWRFELAEELCRGGCADAYLRLATCRGTAETTDILFEVCDENNLICATSPTSVPTMRKVIAKDCIVPGGTGDAYTTEWTDGAWTQTETTVTVDNSDCLIIALPGDTFLVDYPPSESSSNGTCREAGTRGIARFWPDTCKFELIAIDNCGSDTETPTPPTTVVPSMPFGLTRRIRISSQFDCGEQGEFPVLTKDGEGQSVESDCDIPVINTANRQIACDLQYEDVTAVFMPGDCTGIIIAPARALRATANIKTDPLCDDTPVEVEGVEYKDVCNWDGPKSQLYPNNPYLLQACPGQQVELGWNDETCDWDVIQVKHIEFTLYEDFQCDGCNIQGAGRKFAMQTCNCSDATWETLIEGSVVEIVSAFLDCENSRVVVTTKQICSLCYDEETEDTSYINLLEIDVVDGLSANCSPPDSSGGDSSGGEAGSCSAELTTKRYLVFGCDPATSGASVQLSVQAMDVMVDGTLGLTEEDGLCLTPHMATACVLCVTAEFDEEPSCVAIDPCPPEDSSGGS